MDIDKYDRKLLQLIQVNARMRVEDISEAIGLSPASVHRRWKRLREAGVIAAEVAILDEERIGPLMTLIVNIEVERERVDLLQAFRKEVVKYPEVQQCYYVLGEPDFVLILKVRDMKHFDELSRTLFFGNNNLRRFRTSVVMSTVKASAAVLISQNDQEN